jgi:DNA-binding XRE family transcriptional regulator
MIVIGDCPLCQKEMILEKDYLGIVSAFCVSGHRYYLPYGCKCWDSFREHITHVADIRKMIMNGEDLPEQPKDGREPVMIRNTDKTPVYDAAKVAWLRENKEVGERMKGARIKKGLLQREIAAIAGTSQEAIAQYEKGLLATRSMDKIKRMAAALDLTVEDFWKNAETRQKSLANKARPRKMGRYETTTP